MKYEAKIRERTLAQKQKELGKNSWPEFMQHDAVVEKYWPKLYTDFIDFQFAIYLKDKFAGVGNSIPVYWDAGLNKLPARGLDWAMEKAAQDFEKELAPNLLVGVQILIDPELRNRGLSYEFLNLMKHVALIHGIDHVALPVRPTQKHVYPLISMEDYLKWTDGKGEPFDPWIRVHTNSGGQIASICPESMTIKGSLTDWKEWTGLSFQCSGQYTIEKALCPISIDIEKNTGVYIEPNIWIIH